MKKWILISLVFFFGKLVNAQIEYDKYIISGTVVNGETNEVLPSAHIRSSKNIGTKTDSIGNFIIQVEANDTLKITHIGFKTLTFIIPQKENGKYLTKFKLYKDSVSLSTVEILPWPSYNDFKEAFKELNLAEEEIKMEGVKMYQDRNIDPLEYNIGHIVTNPVSFLYDRLLDKKAKMRRRLDRRRKTIEKAAIKNSAE